MRFLIISGPNLNLLGRREPHIYGTVTLDQIHAYCRRVAEELGVEIECFQSNHEGAIIDFLQANIDRANGALLNPGGLTQYGVSLHDCIKAMPFPVIEIHLSNLHAREPWRGHSIIAPAARGTVMGLGWLVYPIALRGLVELVRGTKPE
ncbi:MAG: 3-dehydroquinate dehydratase [Chloroflexota bacterium]